MLSNAKYIFFAKEFINVNMANKKNEQNKSIKLIEEQISGKHKQLIYKHKSTNKFNG